MINNLSDTIAAIATGMNQGGIGVIRVSGEHAIEIVDSVFIPKKAGKEVKNLKTYTAAYGNIVDEDVIDEVIVLWWFGSNEKNIAFIIKKRCKIGRTGRIYKKSFFERKN